MRYSGSKRRFMKQLVPILMEGTNENTTFIDCFAGGMNVVSEMPLKNKIAFDLNGDIISLWGQIKIEGLDSIGLPKNSHELTIEKYEDAKKSYLNDDHRYSAAYLGFVGSACSYGGAWWNGYAHFNPNKNEDHIAEAYNGLKKQVDNFKHIENTSFCWRNVLDYKPDDFRHYPSVVLYCDPPYFGTKQYGSDFDSVTFWEWAKEMTLYGHKVYVSEYTAPDGWECIWSAEKSDGMGTTKKNRKQNKKIEKLFVYKG